MTKANTTDQSRPDYLRPEVVDAEEDLSLIRNLLGGPRAMWEASQTYIRQWTDEHDDVYNIRRVCEPCEDLFGRTLSASVGKLFAKPPKIDYKASEDVLRAHWDNIDASGTKGDVAAKEFASDGIGDGLALILVDHTRAPAGTTVSGANESALGLRPVWGFYERSAICSWRTATINGAEVVVQLVLAEAVEEPVGAFGTSVAVIFRELFVNAGVAAWQTWRSRDEGKNWTVEASGVFKNRNGKTRDTLPIAVAYAGRKEGAFVAVPPLRGVAYANLAHWQVATELTFGSQVSAIEQPVVNGQLLTPDGRSGGRLKLGWLTGVQVEAAGKFGWAGPAGTGLDQLAKRRIEKEQAIAKMGLSFTSRDTRAAETAEAKRMDATAEDSTLATCGQGIEDALNLAWEHHGWYMGLEKAACPTVTINRDFEKMILDAAMIGAVSTLVTSGFSPRAALEIFQRGGLIPADADLDDLEEQWLDGRSAAEGAKVAAAEASGFGLREAA